MQQIDMDSVMRDLSARENILNAKVTAVRRMIRTEMEEMGWEIKPHTFPPFMIVLSNGVRIFPARDTEQNKAGEMIFTIPEG